jgi:hypothetical protein
LPTRSTRIDASKAIGEDGSQRIAGRVREFEVFGAAIDFDAGEHVAHQLDHTGSDWHDPVGIGFARSADRRAARAPPSCWLAGAAADRGGPELLIRGRQKIGKGHHRRDRRPDLVPRCAGTCFSVGLFGGGHPLPALPAPGR